jgi:Anti-sigma-K factor rskA
LISEDPLGVPEHRDTVERLERGVARVAPPDDLFDRILDDARPTATVVPFRRRRVPAWAASAAAAALAAAAAVLVTVNVTNDDNGLGDPIKRVTISNERVDGTLALYRPEGGNRVLVADFDRVSAAPRDHFYELWISRPGSDVKIPIGSFNSSDGKAHLVVPLPTEDKRLEIDISIEEETGPPEHSGQTIASASLT